MRLLLATLVAMSAIGCSDTSTDGILTPAAEGPSFSVKLAPLSPEVAADSIARQRAAVSAAQASRIAHEVIIPATSWQQARQQADAQTAAHPEIARDVLDQTFGAAMLTYHVLPASSPELQREAAHYAEVLIDRNSPEVILIADAIEQARPVLTPQRRAVLALQGSELAQAQLQRTLHCGDCSRAEIQEMLGASPRSDAAGKDMDALRRLEALTVPVD